MSQPIGACIIVHDSQSNRILLGKRKNSYKAGYYGLPGGRTEVHEKVEDAVRRELTEETGLIAGKVERIGVVKEAQDGYDFLHFVFVCTNWKGEPLCIEIEKCEGWEWFPVDGLPEEILQGHATAIKMWLNKTQDWLQEI